MKKKYNISKGVTVGKSGRTYCRIQISTLDKQLAKILKERFAEGDEAFVKTFTRILQDDITKDKIIS